MTSNPIIPLRKQLRQTRCQLPARLRQQAGRQVAQTLQRYYVFKRAQRIGLYLSAFGEVPTQALMQLCFKHHKQVYLPQIRNVDHKLLWVRINRQQWQNRRFSRHRLGMHEPRQRGICVNQLDLLILPLLAFDHTGTRMGMGGGYYDRTLWKKYRAYRLGLAYDFQQVQRLSRQPWDQPLDAILTPSGLRRF